MAYTERTADWCIQKAYLEFKGKAVPPATTTNKYAALLATVDSEQREWLAEPGVEWSSLYQLVSNGTITATDTFDLDDSIDYVSQREGDYVRLVSPDGTQTQQVLLVDPDQLYQSRYLYACAINGRTVNFSKPFLASSTMIGYTLKIPAITIPDDITSGSSLVAVDDPMYLAMRVAADIARNDTVKMGQYQNMLDKAAIYMDKMKEVNGGQMTQVTTPVFMMQGGQTWV